MSQDSQFPSTCRKICNDTSFDTLFWRIFEIHCYSMYLMIFALSTSDSIRTMSHLLHMKPTGIKFCLMLYYNQLLISLNPSKQGGTQYKILRRVGIPNRRGLLLLAARNRSNIPNQKYDFSSTITAH